MLVKDQFKRIEWVDLFDFKISEEGQIISGYKKDLGIEALEKYFLFDIKNVAEVEFGEKKLLKPSDEGLKVPIKEGVESDKIIFSNKELSEKKSSGSESRSHNVYLVPEPKDEVKENNEAVVVNVKV